MADVKEVFGGRDMCRRRYQQLTEWHARGDGVEAPLEPKIPIIDAHHHLTTHKELEGWDSDKFPDLGASLPGSWERIHNLAGRGYKTGFATRYVQEEMLADTAGNNVRGTVYIETGEFYDKGKGDLAPAGETRYAREVFEACVREKRETKLCMGIVPYADLKLGGRVVDVLRAHEAAGGSLVKGIRHSIAADAFSWGQAEGRPESAKNPADMHRLGAFREAVSLLPRFGLVFDCWLFHTQARDLAELARACPGTTIVCNHVAYPLGVGPYAERSRRSELHATWKSDLKELADCPNVVCKVGGMAQACCLMGEPVPWASLERETPPSSQEIAKELAPWYLHAIEVFGPQRCMFESNYPMDRVSCSYTNLWNSFKIIAKDLPFADQSALFHDTAVKIYDLDQSKL